MNYYLLLDFGSTYTKLTAVDIEKEEIIATAKDITTVTSGVMNGFRNALKKLREKLPSDVVFEKTLACSSAAGGLKMIAIGLSRNLTAEAAKRSALGAGARILETYSYELSDDDINEIVNSDCDIILLSGGTDFGNKRTIIYNAKKLADAKLNIPIVVAGNIGAIDEIKCIFDASAIDYVCTENVMPKVNTLNAEPAREVIRKIFMDRIVTAKGMNDVEGEIDGVLMPTPAAVIKGAELLSTGTENEEGMGDLIVVDVGGATTDVHSIGIGFPSDSDIRFEGLREPFAKRTVEGDLGMRYSALSLYEAVGEERLRSYFSEEIDILENCKYRAENIMMVPNSQLDYKFDEAMAGCAVEAAVIRHAGSIRKEYSYSRYIYYQRGKDLTNVKVVIGTGGVIVHSKNPVKILDNVKSYDSNILTPADANFYVDSEYILSAMGLLGMILPDKAVKIMKKYLKKVS